MWQETLFYVIQNKKLRHYSSRSEYQCYFEQISRDIFAQFKFSELFSQFCCLESVFLQINTSVYRNAVGMFAEY